MTLTLLFEQLLNGIQYGVFIFLVSAGLTLVFGIMNLVNLAHGTLFMVGAYAAAKVFQWQGSFVLAVLLAMPITLLVGILLEVLLIGRLYRRSHLVQVIATFGLILFFNQVIIATFGGASQPISVPEFLSGTVTFIPGAPYPTYRLVVIAAGLVVALALFLFIAKTRAGMLIRAGASNAAMVGALGVNIRLLFTLVFGFGALLAGLGGAMAAPLLSVEPGMGESVLILAFVVTVIGGIGSIRGALLASVIVGVVEIIGRSTFKIALAELLGDTAASTAGPSLASMAIYLLMVLVLFFKPQGLFAARNG